MDDFKYANRMERMNATEIRDLLRLTAKPEIISFAGGLPAAELFPVREIAAVSAEFILREGTSMLQYGSVEGRIPFREKICDRMLKNFGTKVTVDEVMVLDGSQQGLDFAGKIFLNPGDVVLCESPTYMGMLNAMDAYECQYVEVPTDEFGIIPSELEKILLTTPRVKLCYVIPDFQNPTGICWTMERRRQFMEVVNKYNLPVIEDNAYYELRFEGERLPALKSLDTKGLVMFMGTFSKIFCPGLRLGWLAADPVLIDKFTSIKQASVLMTSNLDMAVCDGYMEIYDLDAHVEKLKALYHKRRDLIFECMEKEFPPGVEWTKPQGGLFLWLTFPKEISALDVFRKCISYNVAGVIGDCFFPNNKNDRHMRINYSCMPEDKIKEGIIRMGKAIKEVMAESK